VQLYSFDLSVSNVFFFWLKEGGLDTLGSTTVQTMSSAYFNITDEPLPSSSTAISSTTTSLASSSTSATSSTLSSASPTAADQQEATTSNAPGDSVGGGDLPIAAQAGIGVGIGWRPAGLDPSAGLRGRPTCLDAGA
jgi:hypothetical protein